MSVGELNVLDSMLRLSSGVDSLSEFTQMRQYSTLTDTDEYGSLHVRVRQAVDHRSAVVTKSVRIGCEPVTPLNRLISSGLLGVACINF